MKGPDLNFQFQGVLVNIQIDKAETRALGVEGHVCELLLVHRGQFPDQVYLQ